MDITKKITEFYKGLGKEQRSVLLKPHYMEHLRKSYRLKQFGELLEKRRQQRQAKHT